MIRRQPQRGLGIGPESANSYAALGLPLETGAGGCGITTGLKPLPLVLRGLARGRQADPWWSRAGLIAAAALAAALACWSLARNGYANDYYAEAALAASRSWTALLTNAADLSGVVSLDKGPLADWVLGLSGRVFGFSPLSMLLPNAACGVGAVVLLHDLVRRTLGHRTALLAAVMLAVSPVSVAMARYDNPDALLTLLLVGGAWALVRALESGRMRHTVACGALVGLAFETKMLEAFLVLPALAVVLIGAAPGRLGRRVAQLGAGGAALVVVGGAWYTTMMLIPAAQRPYVGDSTGNSWFELIFGANGVSRVSGGGPRGGGFGGATGPLRLFGDQIGGQIAWLLPLGVVGLGVGLATRRRAERTDRRRAVLVLCGLWALTGYGVFSFSQGIFHPYYTSAIAPPIAVLAAAGLVALGERARRSKGARLVLAAAVAGTAGLAGAILARTPDFVPWLRAAVLLAGGLAAVATVLAGRVRGAGSLAVAGGLFAVLAGPSAYAIATVGYAQSGSMPAGGPAQAGGLGFGFGRGGGLPPAVDPALTSYLERNRDGARYLVAAEGSDVAAPIGLATGAPVVTLGGFMGADPAPSVTGLRALIRSGQVRYILTGGGFGGRGRAGRAAFAGAAQPLFGPAPAGGGSPALIGPLLGRGPGGPTDGGAARTAWVRSHCAAVTVPGAAPVPSPRGGSNLYLCTPAQALAP